MEQMREDARKSGGEGCLKAAGIGCAVLVGIAMVLAAMVALNFDAISKSTWFESLRDTARETTEELGHLLAMREKLLERYPAEELEVQVATVDSTKSLQIVVVNPTFDMPREEGATRLLARELATTAAAHHPEIEKFEWVAVSFSFSARGIIVRSSSSEGFRFPVSELVAADAE